MNNRSVVTECSAIAVTDGLYPDGREFLWGYYLIEVADDHHGEQAARELITTGAHHSAIEGYSDRARSGRRRSSGNPLTRDLGEENA